MNIKKSVTEKVLAANRENAKKSTGPGSTVRSSKNAIVHGVLARKLWFENDEERHRYNELIDELCSDHYPRGATQFALVSEMAFTIWNLQKLNGWFSREMSKTDGTAEAMLANLGETYHCEQVPFFADGKSGATARQGWECEQLLVRTGSRTSEEEEGLGTEQVNTKAGQVIVEAKMARTIDLILRYSTAVKRDYYRALGKLQELQRDRWELAGGRMDRAHET
jgi:hypothetical protein